MEIYFLSKKYFLMLYVYELQNSLFRHMFLQKMYFIFDLYLTRLLGRFAPIFYLNCVHVLFVYILKQSRKKFRGFLNTIFLKFLSFVNLPCGHVMSHKKFGPDRFSRFDVYWMQTNRQTNRQTRQIYM